MGRLTAVFGTLRRGSLRPAAAAALLALVAARAPVKAWCGRRKATGDDEGGLFVSF